MWFRLGFLLLVVAFEGEFEFFSECKGEWGSKLLELVDECEDEGLGVKNLFLLLVNVLALGRGLLCVVARSATAEK